MYADKFVFCSNDFLRLEVKIRLRPVTEGPLTHVSFRFNLWHLQVNHKITQDTVFTYLKTFQIVDQDLF